MCKNYSQGQQNYCWDFTSAFYWDINKPELDTTDGGAHIMQKWVLEDWEFELTAINGKAADCRLGIEKGDSFVFAYECPAGMCPRMMAELFTWCEVIRCGGDFTYRGMKEKYEMDLPCPCRSIQFHLKATPINRDENGTPLPNNPRPVD